MYVRILQRALYCTSFLDALVSLNICLGRVLRTSGVTNILPGFSSLKWDQIHAHGARNCHNHTNVWIYETVSSFFSCYQRTACVLISSKILNSFQLEFSALFLPKKMKMSIQFLFGTEVLQIIQKRNRVLYK